MDSIPSRNPNGLQTWLFQHFVVIVVYLDPEITVLGIFCGPFDLTRVSAADRYNLSFRNTVKQSVNVAFALGLYEISMKFPSENEVLLTMRPSPTTAILRGCIV